MWSQSLRVLLASVIIATSLVSASPADAADLTKRDDGTTTVDLGANTGSILHRASGILYGIPLNYSQIPSSFYTGFGMNYVSSGGAQDPGYAGWIYGGYTGRFKGVLNDYKAARAYGAQFILKVSDVWGADGTQLSNAIWPNDNGSWAEYDRFLTQLVADIKANGMTAGLKVLPWNEPDLTIFWTVGQARYLDTWSHAVKFFRANLAGVPIVGPAFANQPAAGNAWWPAWLARIKADGTYPDMYSWHLEGDPNHPLDDLATTQPNMVNLINSYGLPMKEFVIDEYGVLGEQVPGGAAWWIARFERYNMYGMRGNWKSGWQLRDFMAGLLGKSNTGSQTGTGYYGNGEWIVYNYYVTQMTGYRVGTTSSSNNKMDSYATVNTSARRIRVLVGGRQVTGTYTLSIKNLSALGIATSGSISVQTFQFNWSGTFGQQSAWQDLGYYAHTYSGNVLSFPIYQTSTTTTWAFEFSY